MLVQQGHGRGTWRDHVGVASPLSENW
jgi:hypothetical protein